MHLCGIIINFVCSSPETNPVIGLGYHAFYLLDSLHTGATGSTNWRQYLRMGAQQNQLRLYL